MAGPGRPKTDYTGHKFGMVTALHRNGARWLCRCECGAERYFHLSNLLASPPKSHQRCRTEFQYELPLDNVRTTAYKEAS